MSYKHQVGSSILPRPTLLDFFISYRACGHDSFQAHHLIKFVYFTEKQFQPVHADGAITLPCSWRVVFRNGMAEPSR